MQNMLQWGERTNKELHNNTQNKQNTWKAKSAEIKKINIRKNTTTIEMKENRHGENVQRHRRQAWEK